MTRILVLLAHPSIETSRVNHALFSAAATHEQVTSVDLYKQYPDFNIDVVAEQARLLDHDIVIFLFPTFWYSTPALLKEWQDKVLEYGFAYGSSGDKLHGKKLLCVTSAGSPISAYQHAESSDLIIRDLLLPLERMAKDTGFNFVEPLVLYGARTAVEENRLQPHVDQFMTRIESLLLTPNV
ncbi:MAG: NAD(P)H-dependent oxidoreductase [Moritella sp.]|uniref:NAD(P)H-dependent oxidoreductase n=1 Tax=Moritella sp. TaxID=78556 RepID=UPI001D69B82E|nr:NAD(P)H-dependent oxidoreductase [Moritella sp.]NQZ48770.1 NAD(P)H-dependent oxidoreductase [Moritella sp.]